MKLFLSLLVLLSGAFGFALPVLNENVSRSQNCTIYPDSENPHTYYVAPNFMAMARDEKNVPIFSYQEYKTGWFSKNAIVQTTLTSKYYSDEIQAAIAEIKKIDAAAVFNAVPYVDSQIQLNDVLKDLIVSQYCEMKGAVVGAEQVCSFHLNDEGRKLLRRRFAEEAIIIMSLQYTIKGVIKKADGTYFDQDLVFGIAARIGGPELAGHPELFRDDDGEPIDLVQELMTLQN